MGLRRAKASLEPLVARVSFRLQTDFFGRSAILFLVALRRAAVEGRDSDEVVSTVEAAILREVRDRIGDCVPYFKFPYA